MLENRSGGNVHRFDVDSGYKRRGEFRGVASASAIANAIPGGYLITATAGPVSFTFSMTNTAPDMTIVASHAASHFSQGQADATYTLTVYNTGTASTDGTTVTAADTLPSGLTATAMSGIGWTCVVSTVSCTRSDVLVNGASSSYPPITVTVRAGPTVPGSVTNAASVRGGGEANLSNDSSTDLTVVNPIQDVSARVSVTQNGFGRNRSTGL